VGMAPVNVMLGLGCTVCWDITIYTTLAWALKGATHAYYSGNIMGTWVAHVFDACGTL